MSSSSSSSSLPSSQPPPPTTTATTSTTIQIPVGILGATGTVGQRFITLLQNHPYFVVRTLGASPRSAGKPYAEAAARSWKQSVPIPAHVASLVVQECDPAAFVGCRVIFSGLDSDVAGTVEARFVAHDFAVLSNAKNHRMSPLVPLIVPVVNADHFQQIVDVQRSSSAAGNPLLASLAPHLVGTPEASIAASESSLKNGFLITNANCSTTGLVVPLKALQDAFGPISRCVVTTLQAVSGAGYPGVPTLDIIDNVVPYISGEEEKMEVEAAKILGSFDRATNAFVDAPGMKVSATCNRVFVLDGHTECVSLEFARRPAPSVGAVIAALEAYRCDAQALGCPSAPQRAIVVTKAVDRPQPRLDRETERGYAVTVGRVRPCNVFDVKFTLLSHNTVLGAAGSAILNAEVAVAKGLIK
ncbi:hypothetical protein DFJ73DRAFT_838770 [Zopfochytrium polystomum]|nr:hypothetical protein DFJ73DRAFT_838770 [Zopfochytrium polystomum]